MSAREMSLRDKWDSVRVCSAEEALRRKGTSIEVHEDQQVTLTPDDERFARAFARVPLKSFADMQVLGFVPRNIPEESLRGALRSDDAVAYELATKSGLSSSVSECGCTASSDSSHAQRRAHGAATDLRATYNQIRMFNHPTLARVLSDHYQATVAWDDPIAASVHKWIRKFDTELLRDRPILTALVEDVTIHRGATLALENDMRSLYANNIRIHRSGRLVQRGNYVKIWAASVTSFLLELSTVVNAKTAPWHLAH
jgi:hypothetical protein